MRKILIAGVTAATLAGGGGLALAGAATAAETAPSGAPGSTSQPQQPQQPQPGGDDRAPEDCPGGYDRA